MATRLSEISNWKVLLLEAGGDENDFSKIPALFQYTQFSKLNWGYYTTPQKNACKVGKTNFFLLPAKRRKYSFRIP